MSENAENQAQAQVADEPAAPRAESGEAERVATTEEATPETATTSTVDESADTGATDVEPTGTASTTDADAADTADTADPASSPAVPGPAAPEPAAPEILEPDAAGTQAAPEPTAEAEPEETAAAEPETEPKETAAADPETEPGAQAQSPAPAPRPAPRPGPRPTPAAIPHPPRKPAPSGGTATAPTVPTTPDVPALADDSAAAKAAEGFGRVDDEGNVFVRESSGERVVGQFPGVETHEALTLYVRRFLDLQAKVALFETRLTSTDLSVKEIDQTLARLAQETAEPAAVGDLDALRGRVTSLGEAAAGRRAQLEAERAAAKASALEARTEIVVAAEAIAATDPARMQWRPAGEELRSLLARWKEAQRQGPRVDRTSEEALWKRFSHARTAFDRERRHFFAELEQRNASAKVEKEQLVAEAEALTSSTEWGPTSGAYRDLMARWKAAGRANRKDDDALWARFRSAQDTFFQARDAANAATDAEYAANLEVKEKILAQAEALVPVKDLGAARSALRDIQDRWEAAGKVPRGDLQRVEGRLRAVENAVRDAEESQWSRSNPETRARAEGAAAQLESAIADLEAELRTARDAGDERAVSDLETALAARRSWLEQVERAAHDARG